MSDETQTPTETEESTDAAAAVAEAPAEPFDRVELEGFAADDAEAGKTIGQMLSILFIYTVIAMSIVSLWTFAVTRN